MSPRLTIVIAVQGGGARLPALLAALVPQCGDDVEVLVAGVAGDAALVEALKSAPGMKLLVAPGGSLVPHLWRDGILAAEAPRVALTVVHCRPTPAWVANLLAADLETFAGIGGAISNDPDSDACGWAVYMLRYLRYAPPFAARETADLPGDNVVYDRQPLMAVPETFAGGFWEPSVHARLIAVGHRLLLDPAIESIHANGYGAMEFARLRFEHGRAFGLERARAMSLPRRLAYAMLGPLVPLIFGAKVVRLALRNPVTRGRLAIALPHLVFFLFAWGLGELCGVLDALVEGQG